MPKLECDMLGLVFTEFIELMEEKFSPEIADAVITHAAPANGGSYTAVGYYPHSEIVDMVLALSERVNVPVPALIQAFGQHLLSRFTRVYPAMFERHTDAFDFAAAIDGEIHVEVRKLYGNAQLPRFTVLRRDATSMDLHYDSPRGMDDLARGLLEGLFAHYRQPCAIASRPAGGGQGTVFELRLITD